MRRNTTNYKYFSVIYTTGLDELVIEYASAFGIDIIYNQDEVTPSLEGLKFHRDRNYGRRANDMIGCGDHWVINDKVLRFLEDQDACQGLYFLKSTGRIKGNLVGYDKRYSCFCPSRSKEVVFNPAGEPVACWEPVLIREKLPDQKIFYSGYYWYVESTLAFELSKRFSGFDKKDFWKDAVIISDPDPVSIPVVVRTPVFDQKSLPSSPDAVPSGTPADSPEDDVDFDPDPFGLEADRPAIMDDHICLLFQNRLYQLTISSGATGVVGGGELTTGHTPDASLYPLLSMDMVLLPSTDIAVTLNCTYPSKCDIEEFRYTIRSVSDIKVTSPLDLQDEDDWPEQGFPGKFPNAFFQLILAQELDDEDDFLSFLPNYPPEYEPGHMLVTFPPKVKGWINPLGDVGISNELFLYFSFDTQRSACTAGILAT